MGNNLCRFGWFKILNCLKLSKKQDFNTSFGQKILKHDFVYICPYISKLIQTNGFIDQMVQKQILNVFLMTTRPEKMKISKKLNRLKSFKIQQRYGHVCQLSKLWNSHNLDPNTKLIRNFSILHVYDIYKNNGRKNKQEGRGMVGSWCHMYEILSMFLHKMKHENQYAELKIRDL